MDNRIPDRRHSMNGPPTVDERNGERKTRIKERTQLTIKSYGERKTAGVEHKFGENERFSLEQFKHRTSFLDKVLQLAELPKPEELPEILTVSNRANLPSIWRRAQASTLETNAAALIAVLAFSRREEWIPIIRQFIKEHGLEVNLHGRPTMNPSDRMDFVRGAEIDQAIKKVRRCFEFKQQLVEEQGELDVKALRSDLEGQGFDKLEVSAVLSARTLQDAACRYYRETRGKQLNIDLKSIRNSYSRYRHAPQQK